MPRPIRVAAAGDVHCDEVNRDEIERAFTEVEGEVDAILLAGDLTTYGELEQGELLAELCAPLETPIFAVLGNHDWHCGQATALTTALEAAGVRMIDRGHAIQQLDGVRLGVAGAKGFVGGFPDSALPDFGEPLLRRVYAETTAEVEALAAGLTAIADCATGSRCCTTRRRRARLKASHAASTRSSAPTGWPSRSSSTTRTWRFTATRTSAPFRARSATCRCTTSPCPRWRATSSSSSSTTARCAWHEPSLATALSGRAGFAGASVCDDRSTRRR